MNRSYSSFFEKTEYWRPTTNQIEIQSSGLGKVVNDFKSQPPDIQARMRKLAQVPCDRVRTFSAFTVVSHHGLALVVRGPLAEEVAGRVHLLTKAVRPVEATGGPDSGVP